MTGSQYNRYVKNRCVKNKYQNDNCNRYDQGYNNTSQNVWGDENDTCYDDCILLTNNSSYTLYYYTMPVAAPYITKLKCPNLDDLNILNINSSKSVCFDTEYSAIFFWNGRPDRKQSPDYTIIVNNRGQILQTSGSLLSLQACQNNKIIITNGSKSGLSWWGWLLIIVGILIVIFIIWAIIWAASGKKEPARPITPMTDNESLVLDNK